MLADGERWFVRHGLPYFVVSEREAARAGLRPARLALVVGVAVLFGAALGQYVWTVVADAAESLGGGPVGADALVSAEVSQSA